MGDFSKVTDLKEPIEYNKQNVDALLSHSRLSSAILGAFDDYDFWFPAAEDAEENSVSGSSGNTGE